MHADDLDHLVAELNQRAGGKDPDRLSLPAAKPSPLEGWLRRVREADGSDLLLVAGAAPTIRAADRLLPASDAVVDSDDIEAAVLPFAPSPAQARYRAGGAVDFAIGLGPLGRFRLNLHRERRRSAATIRALPLRVPRVADLNFTHDIAVLSRLPRGLVLIGGAAGSGKTTTLAALIAEINTREQRHIVTIEDPIEYEHRHGSCLVEQVEIGVDAPDFPTALRAALRQAPDVIVIGELRDTESMRIALQAAETGHLVLATVHATDAAAALSRITDAFTDERQNSVRQELAMAITAVLTQTLVPTTKGHLVPAAELLMAGYGTRQHIRRHALQHLNQEISITRKNGSFLLEESLAALVRNGLLERQDALGRAHHPEELTGLLGS
jgi:twitching motility protein PilT